MHIMAVRERGDGKGHEVLLEKQFRPPAGKVVVEFPAGLIDEGEAVEECAVRELREETGYVSEVVGGKPGPASFSAPATSFSRHITVKVKIDPSLPENKAPKPQLEDDEFIQCFWVPLNELHAECKRFEADGLGIDSKVGSFAEGIEMAKLLQS